MLSRYLRALYQHTMREAYDAAYARIAAGVGNGAVVLDCGAGNGSAFESLAKKCQIGPAQYHGVEWHAGRIAEGRERGLQIVQGNLDHGIPHEAETFSCVYALSVLEHLLHPCRFLRDCHRVLRPGGRLVLLTPNISTYFTAFLILLGKMPSSGPHPDSDALLKREEMFKVSSEALVPDTESDTPMHRHLVVFSYRALRAYLRMIGFIDVAGHGFGLYPFPVFMQAALQRIDPFHCHQMVFVASKP